MFNSKLQENFKKNALAYAVAAAVIIIILFFLFKRSQEPKRSGANTFSPVSQAAHKAIPSSITQPVAQQKPQATPTSENDGIISYQVLPVNKKFVETISRKATREEVVLAMTASVSGIEDDIQAKNAVITQLKTLEFKLNAQEFAAIIMAAGIDDDFYYSNVVKMAFAHLEFPLSKSEIKLIAAPLNEDYLRHKMEDLLFREQWRNK